MEIRVYQEGDWFSLTDCNKDELPAVHTDQEPHFIVIGTIYFTSQWLYFFVPPIVFLFISIAFLLLLLMLRWLLMYARMMITRWGGCLSISYLFPRLSLAALPRSATARSRLMFMRHSFVFEFRSHHMCPVVCLQHSGISWVASWWNTITDNPNHIPYEHDTLLRLQGLMMNHA